VKDLDISIIVNNVGTMYVGDFEAVPDDKIREMTIVNCLPVVMITKVFINKLLNRNKKSAVINLSSAAASGPFPYYSAYSATKIFDDYFSQSVGYELKDKIDFLSL
jgi:17beta-estradiol 17-dehydrogenase / very-long-chain 3-oxoacyl-CoA reductase